MGLYRDNGKENGNCCLGFRSLGFRVGSFRSQGCRAYWVY